MVQLLEERWLAKGEHSAELTLRDKLEAQAMDQATIFVQDTFPPELTLELQPDVTGMTWMADRWWLESYAQDLCDGELVSDHSLLLEEQFLAAESILIEDDALQAVVRQGPAGLLVELHGDPAVIEPLWLEAQQSGRLTASKEQSLQLELTRPAGDGVLAHYRFDEHARLIGALSVTDHLLEAEAIDTEGLTGRAVRSLRQRIAEICAQLPAHVICGDGSQTGGTNP